MKQLYFWHVPLPLVDALAVTDAEGTLYYLSLGKWSKLVDLVKKDFRQAGKATLLISGKVPCCTAIAATTRTIQQALDNPHEIDRLRPSISYKYIFGTPSQRKVWDYLVLKVPVGTTTTYSEVAMALGKRDSARVVGNACGANKIALFVPCHRVLTANNTISGYRYGTQLKLVLLQHEKQVIRKTGLSLG